MAIIESLTLSQFRLFKTLSIHPHPKLNILCGPNATGKTSVLESIHYLSSGQSFCHKNLSHLFHQPSRILSNDPKKKDTPVSLPEKLSVQALVHIDGDGESLPPAHYKTTRYKDKNYYHIGNKIQKSVLKHAQNLAVLLITPENLMMVGGMPALRRKRLNWGCFYSFPLYHKIYHNYQRALQQRNKALKQNFKSNEIQRWDTILAREARYISECREIYIQQLEPHFKFALTQTLHSLDIENVTLSYHNTVSSSLSTDLSEQFWLQMYEKGLAQDRHNQSTHYGPHRGDLLIKWKTKPIIDQLSRGQWKILSTVLLIAQALLLKQEINIDPIILIDDFSSELDHRHRLQLLQYIEKKVGGQTFISTVTKDLWQDYPPHNIKLFELNRDSSSACIIPQA